MQSDVMIVAGTLTNKMAPALRKVRVKERNRRERVRRGLDHPCFALMRFFVFPPLSHPS